MTRASTSSAGSRHSLDAAHAEGGSPRDAIDGFYFAGRLRRWFAPQADTGMSDRVYPLYSLFGTRAAFALGGEARRDEVLHLELMRAACPELAEMPFAGPPWPEPAVRRLPGADRYPPPSAPPPEPVPAPAALFRRRRHRREPVRTSRSEVRTATPPLTVNQEVQRSIMSTQVEVLRAHVDIGADHPLFDFIDSAALHHALDHFGELNVNAKRSVHGAATAAMWLSGCDMRPPSLPEPSL